MQATNLAGVDAAQSSTEALLSAILSLFRSSRRFDNATQPLLTWPNYAVLHNLCHATHDVRLTEIADALGYDISVLSRQVSALIDQGLVTRVRDPNDGRAWLLRLTEQGQQRLVDARARWVSQMSVWLANFDDADRLMCSQLIAALSQGIKNSARDTRPTSN